jgi:hypothetical protein
MFDWLLNLVDTVVSWFDFDDYDDFDPSGGSYVLA